MKINKELTAAGAAPLILMILKRGESYGYDLIRTVKELSGERWDWTEGMLYPILHRMEKAGLTRSFWQKSPAGRKRKYYRITRAGQKELADLTAQWRLVAETLDRADRWGGEQ